MCKVLVELTQVLLKCKIMKKFKLILLLPLLFIVGMVMLNEKIKGQLSERQLALLSAPPLDNTVMIDRIVVYKSKREMQVFNGDKLLKTYPISLGFNPIGHKQFEGDGKTPEGIYYINDRNAKSGYYKNLGISYPNEKDIEYANSQGKSAGGLIKIHGVKNGLWHIVGDKHLLKDWTHGCIAVSDYQMEELFNLVADNAMIDIRP